MRFVVGDTVTSSANNGEVPSTLKNVTWPMNKDTVDHVFKFQHGGDALWTINGVDFTDVNNRVLARPQQVSPYNSYHFAEDLTYTFDLGRGRAVAAGL